MLRSLGAALLLALVSGPGALAATQQAQFIVQVTVPSRVTLAAAGPPVQLSISADDISRGYKDVSARYAVDANTNRDWLLLLSRRLGVAESVEVRGLSTAVVLREQPVEVYQPGARKLRSLDLEFRFMLKPDAEAGSYELPVQVSATTL